MIPIILWCIFVVLCLHTYVMMTIHDLLVDFYNRDRDRD
jgi:hypothetical protein